MCEAHAMTRAKRIDECHKEYKKDMNENSVEPAYLLSQAGGTFGSGARLSPRWID